MLISLVHELIPTARALLLVFWPDGVAIGAIVRFVFDHEDLLGFPELYALGSRLYRAEERSLGLSTPSFANHLEGLLRSVPPEDLSDEI